VVSAAALRAAATPALRSQMIAPRAELVRMRDLMRPRLAFTDVGVPLDRHYEYVVRAVYLPSGLESEDASGVAVAVPSPARPPAVAGGAYAGFTASEALGTGRVLADTAGFTRDRAFTAARLGLPRLAPAPRGFRRAGPSTQTFTGARALKLGTAKSGASRTTSALSAPSAATGSTAIAGVGLRTISPEPLRDGPRATIVPRVPVFAKPDLSKLRLNLLRSRDDGGVVALQWTAVSQLKDVSYKLQRKYGDLDWVDIGTTPPGRTTFRDVLPRSMARTYSYRVMAISRWGVVGPPAAAITAAVPSTVRPGTPNILAAVPDRVADRSIRVRIDPNPADESVTTYRVLRDGAAVGTVTPAANAELAFMDTGLVAGRSYRYQVVAETAAGLISAPSRALSAVAIRLAAAAPSALSATAGAAGVRLTWNAAAGAVSYSVRRRTGSTSPAQVLAGSLRGAVQYLDVTAVPARPYQYEVLATDEFGNTSPAATVSVTPP
jgi:hypothetical protein